MNNDSTGCFISIIGAFCFLLILGACWAVPHYNVWQQGLEGRAVLAKAEYSRQVQTCEAKAKLESAKSLAEAEIVRADGVAKANKIIGDSLKENEAYLRYLYINHLSESKDRTVIYIPTEAGLPILEAGRNNVSK